MEKYTFKEKIYDYINSKAISEYCRKIKHEFSVVECALPAKMDTKKLQKTK